MTKKFSVKFHTEPGIRFRGTLPDGRTTDGKHRSPSLSGALALFDRDKQK